jgi:hypothetical protein
MRHKAGKKKALASLRLLAAAGLLENDRPVLDVLLAKLVVLNLGGQHAGRRVVTKREGRRWGTSASQIEQMKGK